MHSRLSVAEVGKEVVVGCICLVNAVNLDAGGKRQLCWPSTGMHTVEMMRLVMVERIQLVRHSVLIYRNLFSLLVFYNIFFIINCYYYF
jgi:hypothetical protein